MSAPAAPSTSLAPTPGVVWRRWRGTLVVGLLVLFTAGVVAVFSGGDSGEANDPADSSLSGSLGLARLLAQEGVRVERVTSAATAAAAAEAAGGDALLLVTALSYLTPGDLRTLADAPGDRLLAGVVSPHLAPGVTAVDRARPRSREPECALPAAVKAGSAYLGGVALDGPPGAIGCYPSADGPTLVSYTHQGRRITVAGGAEFLTNLRLAEDGNAALAMNLTGARSTVVWLTAPDEPPPLAGPSGRSFEELIPAGVWWAAGQLALAVALLALWRGRRLGPVVAERLPVVVRAAETVEGRGRLYRAGRARDRASAALRAGLLDRIVPRLGLPPDSGRDAVIAAVTARTGRDGHEVAAILYGPPPADDAGLVALASTLDTLERQVKDS
ncbi:hypothetical protein HNP84_004555 [Thermocatellispora tengchongensis]|uniref:DUF4350 domain-containing protein n=1 Tax=Thermocatellispora tengchongensis TaxID=1073253 RepID=A0A840PAD4_9ACTN|nr:DUF4350 domain-containing protein [Thermocatellispora tengchongensis]MBB5134821.1 hypothetical protein [Thermocatellispora tengchongensis]